MDLADTDPETDIDDLPAASELAELEKTYRTFPYAYSAEDEYNLLLLAKAGDEKAKSSIILSDDKVIRDIAKKTVFRSAGKLEQDDLVQTAYLKLIGVKFDNYTPVAGVRVRPWLASIARNAMIDMQRRSEVRNDLNHEMPQTEDGEDVANNLTSSAPGPEQEAASRETLQIALYFMEHALPDREREVMNATVEEMSGVEIAEILNIHEGSVKTYRSRSRARLNEVFETPQLQAAFFADFRKAQSPETGKELIAGLFKPKIFCRTPSHVSAFQVAYVHLNEEDFFLFLCAHLGRKPHVISLGSLADTLNIKKDKVASRLSSATQTVLENMPANMRTHSFCMEIENNLSTKVIQANPSDNEIHIARKKKTKHIQDPVIAYIIAELAIQHIHATGKIPDETVQGWKERASLIETNFGLSIDELVREWAIDAVRKITPAEIIKRRDEAISESLFRFHKSSTTWQELNDALAVYMDAEQHPVQHHDVLQPA